MDVKVSLFASSVRPMLYQSFFDSLSGTEVTHEVVFAGNCPEESIAELMLNAYTENRGFKYIRTGNIKPAQCYEIARRNCVGEVVVWVADDCEFPNNVIGKAYNYWKSQGNEKLVLSIQTRETGYNLPIGKFFNMKHHSFFGFRPETPLMAPLGMMSRKFLDDLGGLDRRYICGQYENDIIMRAIAEGGKVEIFGGEDAFIDIDHLGKSMKIGESRTQKDFLKRPFAKGYHIDRQVLEGSWVRDGKVVFDRNDKFEPYEEKDLLTKSQSNKGIWE